MFCMVLLSHSWKLPQCLIGATEMVRKFPSIHFYWLKGFSMMISCLSCLGSSHHHLVRSMLSQLIQAQCSLQEYQCDVCKILDEIRHLWSPSPLSCILSGSESVRLYFKQRCAQMAISPAFLLKISQPLQGVAAPFSCQALFCFFDLDTNSVGVTLWKGFPCCFSVPTEKITITAKCKIIVRQTPTHQLILGWLQYSRM